MYSKLKIVSGWMGTGDGSDYFRGNHHPSSGLSDYLQQLISALRSLHFREPVELHFNVQPTLSSASKILFLLEHKYIRPQNFFLNPRRYKAVFGWDADLNMHENFVYTRYPHNFSLSPFNKSRSKKYVMLCSNRNLLCGPKASSIYNKRQEVISYFERQTYDFHLYGAGWRSPFTQAGLIGFARSKLNSHFFESSLVLANYRGLASNKFELLREAEFNFCFENIDGYNGYVSEKIWDALSAGCIPVYWPSSRLDDLYVPSDSYIDASAFDSICQLISFLEDMSISERLERQRYSLEVAAKMKNEISVDFYVDHIANKIRSLNL
tara:strand:+ start:1599 stop:2567 length:969 start_codon:yes stop_codon:yes gene_type:complete